MKKLSLQSLALVFLMIWLGVSAGRLVIQVIWLHFQQESLREYIAELQQKGTETEASDLSVYFDEAGQAEIWFFVAEENSDVRLDFFDTNSDLVESSEEMVCQTGVYILKFPVLRHQLSGVYFCRLIRNEEIVRIIKFVYLAGQANNSARPEWAEFFFF